MAAGAATNPAWTPALLRGRHKRPHRTPPLGHLCKRPFTDNLSNCKNRSPKEERFAKCRRNPGKPPFPAAWSATRASPPRSRAPIRNSTNFAPRAAKPLLEEHASGADRSRPVLARLLREIRPGETLVVVRLDRLARSVSHLLAVIEQLEANGAHFRSLHDPIDTSTPQGMFSLQVLGAVAQLERALIAERTKAGLNAARSRGRIGGNPGLRAGDPDAIRKVTGQPRRRASRMAFSNSLNPGCRRYGACGQTSRGAMSSGS